MRTILKTSLIAASLIFAVPMAASAVGFDSTVQTQISGPIKIEVLVGEELAYRANNLPKKLSDRGSGGPRSTAFSQNGHYGEKDIAKLQSRLQERIAKQFTKRGIALSDSAPTVLRVTLTDVSPNRPTFRQLSKEPGLSYQSFGRGGAEFEAELISAGGGALGTMSYSYYEDDIRDARYGGTWTDARRSIDRFARHAAKDLANGPRS